MLYPLSYERMVPSQGYPRWDGMLLHYPKVGHGVGWFGL
jgi:hypothetical protein